MAVSLGADSGSAERIWRDVVNDIVRTFSIARYSSDSQKVIQIQGVPHAPGYIVIGARSIAAHPYGPQDHFTRSIKRQSAAKHVNAADLVPDHRVILRAIAPGGLPVRDARIHRIAELQSVQAPAGLHGRVEIRGRERQSAGLSGAVAAR